ncbi:hypothetical protein L211DRAFT_847328 [Terfezia boudieri ATCC MYA-4762]|uniref:JmjC domain-containing protein n=1 Tax=Terfezia boudieri ATCC MYA-4762 TaxID=1051890 RepID=A0A3N4M8C7_9PEZI|nr:hypothetical protein L211DRAFT_847328 [Terfezia boudieri ATCC MYA-4762]
MRKEAKTVGKSRPEIEFMTNQTPTKTFVDLHSDRENRQAYVNAHVSHQLGDSKITVLELAWQGLLGTIAFHTGPGEVLFVPAGWFHATYTLESGFLIGIDFLLPRPSRQELLAAALKDEWEIANRVQSQEDADETSELLLGLATQLMKEDKTAPSDALLASIQGLLEWERKLKTVVEEEYSARIQRAVEKIQKYVTAYAT